MPLNLRYMASRAVVIDFGDGSSALLFKSHDWRMSGGLIEGMVVMFGGEKTGVHGIGVGSLEIHRSLRVSYEG